MSAHFRLVWAPLQGVYENRWEQGFRQDDPLVRLEVVGRVGSFAPCCPGRARPPPAPTRWSLRSPRTLDLDGAETTSQLPIRYFSSSNQFTTIRNRSRSTAPPAWAAGDTDVTSCVVTIRSPSGWRDQLNGL